MSENPRKLKCKESFVSPEKTYRGKKNAFSTTRVVPSLEKVSAKKLESVTIPRHPVPYVEKEENLKPDVTGLSPVKSLFGNGRKVYGRLILREDGVGGEQLTH